MRPGGDAFRTTRALPPQPLQRRDEDFAARVAQRLILCKLADGEVYASCSRAHGSQRATPLISTTARPWQGLSVLLRTSHKTASFASVK